MAKGAVLEGAAAQHAGPLALIELQNGDAEPQYVAGTENFYVITRYNWSSYYAMAVIDLGREVKAALPAAAPADAPRAEEPPAAAPSADAPPAPVGDAQPPAAAPAESPAVPSSSDKD
jgi:hypothetical protein